MSDLKRRVGYAKWRGERVVSNIQRIVSFVVLAASTKILDISPWWWVTLPVTFVIMWYADKWWIYPGESEASLSENPEWQRAMGQAEEYRALRHKVIKYLEAADSGNPELERSAITDLAEGMSK